MHVQSHMYSVGLARNLRVRVAESVALDDDVDRSPRTLLAPGSGWEVDGFMWRGRRFSKVAVGASHNRPRGAVGADPVDRGPSLQTAEAGRRPAGDLDGGSRG